MSNARNLANLLGTNTKVKDVDVDGTELVLDADADTSITADTDDRVDIKVAGSDVVHVTSTGLGIGDTSPSFKLSVNGNVGISQGSTLFFVNDGGFSPSITNSGTVTDMIFSTNNSESMRISSGNLGIGNTSPGTYGKLVVDDGKISLVTDLSDSRRISFWSTANGNSENAFIQSQNDGATTNTGEILFATKNASGTLAERVRLTADGYLLINRTNTASGSKAMIDFQDGGRGLGIIGPSSGGGSQAMHFYTGGSQVGSISLTTSATSFNTSSDYRLKENVVTDWDATTRLKQLKPSRFNFKADKDTTLDGFLAHEVSGIVPEAVSGDKDAMTKEVLYVDGDEIPKGKKVGDVKTPSQIEPQGIDQSKLVPLLVKTVQELEARITALESK